MIANGKYTGDIIHEDTDRTMNVTIQNATVTGHIEDAYIKLDQAKWIATENSKVCLVGSVEPEQIDAASGVIVMAKAGEGCALNGEYTLASGGILTVQ